MQDLVWNKYVFSWCDVYLPSLINYKRYGQGTEREFKMLYDHHYEYKCHRNLEWETFQTSKFLDDLFYDCGPGNNHNQTSGINHENMRYTRVQMEYTFSLVHLVQPVQQVTAGSHRVVFANKNENKYWEWIQKNIYFFK